jgi:hypothetical protein
MSEPDATPELAALEAELRRLAPREGDIDRDALLFRAGRASARGGWAWPLTAALSTCVAVALAGVLTLRPPRVVYVTVERPAAPAEESPPISDEPPPAVREPVAVEELPPYQRLQEHLLRWGLDGLPAPPPPAESRPASDHFSHYSQLLRGESSP